jgi:hypothetical protein
MIIFLNIITGINDFRIMLLKIQLPSILSSMLQSMGPEVILRAYTLIKGSRIMLRQI